MTTNMDNQFNTYGYYGDIFEVFENIIPFYNLDYNLINIINEFKKSLISLNSEIKDLDDDLVKNIINSLAQKFKIFLRVRKYCIVSNSIMLFNEDFKHKYDDYGLIKDIHIYIMELRLKDHIQYELVVKFKNKFRDNKKFDSFYGDNEVLINLIDNKNLDFDKIDKYFFTDNFDNMLKKINLNNNNKFVKNKNFLREINLLNIIDLIKKYNNTTTEDNKLDINLKIDDNGIFGDMDLQSNIANNYELKNNNLYNYFCKKIKDFNKLRKCCIIDFDNISLQIWDVFTNSQIRNKTNYEFNFEKNDLKIFLGDLFENNKNYFFEEKTELFNNFFDKLESYYISELKIINGIFSIFDCLIKNKYTSIFIIYKNSIWNEYIEMVTSYFSIDEQKFIKENIYYFSSRLDSTQKVCLNIRKDSFNNNYQPIFTRFKNKYGKYKSTYDILRGFDDYTIFILKSFIESNYYLNTGYLSKIEIFTKDNKIFDDLPIYNYLFNKINCKDKYKDKYKEYSLVDRYILNKNFFNKNKGKTNDIHNKILLYSENNYKSWVDNNKRGIRSMNSLGSGNRNLYEINDKKIPHLGHRMDSVFYILTKYTENKLPRTFKNGKWISHHPYRIDNSLAYNYLEFNETFLDTIYYSYLDSYKKEQKNNLKFKVFNHNRSGVVKRVEHNDSINNKKFNPLLFLIGNIMWELGDDIVENYNSKLTKYISKNSIKICNLFEPDWFKINNNSENNYENDKKDNNYKKDNNDKKDNNYKKDNNNENNYENGKKEDNSSYYKLNELSSEIKVNKGRYIYNKNKIFLVNNKYFGFSDRIYFGRLISINKSKNSYIYFLDVEYKYNDNDCYISYRCRIDNKKNIRYYKDKDKINYNKIYSIRLFNNFTFKLDDLIIFNNKKYNDKLVIDNLIKIY